MSDDVWTVPGVSFTAPAPGPAADVLALGAAVDEALSVVPVALPPEVAVARAERLLALQERVSALALVAVADVDARELWRSRAAGSSRGWLRTLPCGDRGQVTLARLLEGRPVLASALAAGQVSVRTAGVVARELARVPAQVDAAQLQGVLLDGVGDLLSVWAGAACFDPTDVQEVEFEARRELLSAAVRVGLADTWCDTAGQLEPAFVLAATVLAPAELESGLRLLVDALQPAPDADALGEREHRSRGLSLRKLSGGGWSLRAHLTDEVGELLFQALRVREDGHPLQKARATRAAAQHDVFGADGEPDVRADDDVSADSPDVSDPDLDPEDAAVAGEGAPADSGSDAVPDGSSWGAAGPGVPFATTGRAEEGTPLASV